MDDQLSSDLAALRLVRKSASPRRQKRSWLYIIGVLGLAMFGLAGGLFLRKLAVPKVVTYELTGPVQARNVPELQASGYVIARRVSRVGVQRPGRIAKIDVDVGTTVKQGQILFSLDSQEQMSALNVLRARQRIAEARIVTAEANLSDAVTQVDRASLLAERQAGTTAAVIDLENKVRSLRAALQTAQAELLAIKEEVRAAEENVARSVIVAPMAGTVVQRAAQQGDIVVPQEPVLELADLTSLVIEIELAESKLHQLKAADVCSIVLDSFPDFHFDGKIGEILPRVNKTKGSFTLRVEFEASVLADNQALSSIGSKTLPDAGPPQANFLSTRLILPGMASRVDFCRVRTTSEEAQGSRYIPASAVVKDRGIDEVFVVVNGKLRRVPVRLGSLRDGQYLLLQGLEVGSHIVQSPYVGLLDGQKVEEGQP